MVKRNAMDGFVPRRHTGQIGEQRLPKPAVEFDGNQNSTNSLRRTRFDGPEEDVSGITLETVGNDMSQRDLEDSLRQIEDEQKHGGKPKKSVDKKVGKKRQPKKIAKILAILLLLGLITIGGWIGVKAMFASDNIFKGDILGLVQSKPLKVDANGRSNIIIVGTSEDDQGHDGAYLTDSMMIVSVSATKKDAYMFSIPRDLYVKYGMSCNAGYAGKINEYFNCVNENWNDPKAEEERLDGIRKFSGDIFGLEIPYAVHVNNTVIKNAVDAVGGVDVNIEGSGGAPGILDRNFDWRCNYKCYFVKYNNGVHHLDGTHALFLAMARGHSEPTYGLGNSNFDRERNQQKIMVALKDKAVSTGTLSNPAKVTGLIDALGNNLRTNFETAEIRTLIDLGGKIDTAHIKSLSLYEEGNQLVESGNIGGASVVVPMAGTYDYSDIRAYINKKINATPVTQEAAVVAVYNGSGVAGIAQAEADKLAALGMNTGEIGNAPESNYVSAKIYKVSDVKKPATAAKLESLYGAKLQFEGNPITGVAENTDFVVILSAAQAKNQGNSTNDSSSN